MKRDGKISKHPPIRKLEFSIEDQIYRIFKKARLVVPSLSNSSNNHVLFHLPLRDGFVYVENESPPTSRGSGEMAQSLHELYTMLGMI